MRTVLTKEQKEIIAWRQRLIRLPESVFLDLWRNYLGEIRTPFNKQDLLARLESHLGLAWVRERIVDLLTLADRQILSAVALLDDCEEERLFRLLGGGRAYIDFHLHLLNLEDRLLLWREETGAGLKLNPLLRPVLEPLLSLSLVVPGDDCPEASGGPAPWLDDAYLAAFHAFVRELPDLTTAQGQPKKRALEHYRQRFAGLVLPSPQPAQPESEAEADPQRDALRLTVDALRRLGLIRPAPSGWQNDLERWLEFATLEPALRVTLARAAAAWPGDADDGMRTGDYYRLPRIASFARTLGEWLSGVPAGQAFRRTALAGLWNLTSGMGLDPGRSAILVDTLAALGLFLPHGEGWRVNPAAVAPAHTAPGGLGGRPALVLTPSFELSLEGAALPFDELLTIAGCATLRAHGHSTQYVLDRASVQAGCARGIGGADLAALLATRSGRDVPQNVRVSIAEWETDFQSFQAFDGVVLVTRGGRAAVLEHLDTLNPYVLARPAPGVVVLDRLAQPDWLPLLKAAGFPDQAVPTVNATSPGGSEGLTILPPFASLDLEGVVSQAPAPSSPPGLPAYRPADEGRRQALVESLAATLAGREMAPEIREELEKRLRSGLVLDEAQLVPATVRLERGEAGGLDYLGKVRLIEQAIKNRHDLLEVTQHAEGSPAWKLLVWPQKFRQQGAELILIAQTVPEGRELSIPAGRILQVRRIRSSIFS